jgi:hypothetical protein
MDAQTLVKTEAQVVVKRDGFLGWAQRLFSDDPSASSSRVLTFILALVIVSILGGVFHHICKITDNTALALWLTALPVVIMALAGFISSPYLIKQGSASITDFAGMFKRQ